MVQQTLEVVKATELKEKPDPATLKFGRQFSDHMFMMDYSAVDGWHQPRVVPYQPLELDPSAMVFHYGQSVFEGLKAYRSADGNILLFRPEENFRRLNESCDRLCIPQVNEEAMLEYLKELVKLDKDWVPSEVGTSLYIRPFIISTEPTLDVSPARAYTLMIILSPVGSFYKGGIDPVGIFVEDEYTRSAPGGTGYAKTAGNYSGAYKAQERASTHGKAQVLWLDGVEKKYIEEVGSMNVFFKINGEIHTPALSGSILDGITRKSVIELLESNGMNVRQRQISMDELIAANEAGSLQEVFGTGTAAVISPVGRLEYKGQDYVINGSEMGETARWLHETLVGIQTGEQEDPFGWTIVLET
ncbi:branched-chain amino acid aminotransferase [Natribacillus halophilus]|uniref:Branched-chain-amino-acid aminotransferase n=1 Tax=Natribacillus halophilus TaxID=549003 RepID=A0A1G8QCI7_9BACI|nr:branched-chain amino acid aminotransferase [Natribacillus halophilus]SDJ02431.1 branched chain amino acid aminotransferase apoenzyme [Natribacillus halophilus]